VLSARGIQDIHCSREGRTRRNVSCHECADVGGAPSVYDQARHTEAPVLGKEIPTQVVTSLLQDLRGQGITRCLPKGKSGHGKQNKSHD